MGTQRRKRDRSAATLGAAMAARGKASGATVVDEHFRQSHALRGLSNARQGVAEAERQLRAAVTEARSAGATWLDIGQVLDVSPQAAHQRFGR